MVKRRFIGLFIAYIFILSCLMGCKQESNSIVGTWKSDSVGFWGDDEYIQFTEDGRIQSNRQPYTYVYDPEIGEIHCKGKEEWTWKVEVNGDNMTLEDDGKTYELKRISE